MDPQDLAKEIQRLRNQAEDYHSSVRTLIGFCALVLHDGSAIAPGSRFNFGRRMNLPPKPEGALGEIVTPDLVVQRDERYGVVGELKTGLPKDKTRWTSVVDQSLQYCEELEGWWTANQKLEKRDVILLLHITRSRAFAEYVNSLPESDRESFRQVSVVEFTRSDQSSPNIFYRAESTLPADEVLAEKLRGGKAVPLAKFLATFPTLKFYDANPPLLYVLVVLWQNVVASRLVNHAYSDELKATPIPLEVSEVTSELQRAFGSAALYVDSRSPSFPREEWVRAALSFLASKRLAIAHPSDRNRFTVLFRRFKEDVEAKFASMIVGDPTQAVSHDSSDQLSLFSDVNPESADTS